MPVDLTRLLRHRARLQALDPALVAGLEAQLHEEARRENRPLVVAVVGEKKAGKSSFLNALLGETILDSAVRESTRVPVLVQQGPLHIRAVFADGRQEVLERDDRGPALQEALRNLELERSEAQRDCAREAADLANQVEAVQHALAQATLPTLLRQEQTGIWRLFAALLSFFYPAALRAYHQLQTTQQSLAAQRPASLLRLEALTQQISLIQQQAISWRQENVSVLSAFIAQYRDTPDVIHVSLSYPSPRLGPYTWMDTPGVNSADADPRGWQAILREADLCLLLSDLRQAASQSTLRFAAALLEEFPTLVFGLSHWDQAAAEASDPQELEEAAHRASRRFARELGIPEPDCLRISSVAPEKLDAELLRLQHWITEENPREKRLVLLRQRATEGLALRLTQLLAEGRSALQNRHRLPPLESLEAAASVGFQELWPTLEEQLETGIQALLVQLRTQLQSCNDRASVLSWVEHHPIRQEAAIRLLLERLTEAGWAQTETLFRWLKVEQAQRIAQVYGIPLPDDGSAPAFPDQDAGTLEGKITFGVGERTILAPLGWGPGPLLPMRQRVPTVGDLPGALAVVTLQSAGFGATAGALLGSAVLPGLGTLVGGAVGAVAGWFRGVDGLKKQVLETQQAQLMALKPALLAELRFRLSGLENDLQRRLRADLARAEPAVAALRNREAAEIQEEENTLQELAVLLEQSAG